MIELEDVKRQSIMFDRFNDIMRERELYELKILQALVRLNKRLKAEVEKT